MNWQYDDHYFLCARRVYEKREIVKSWMFVFNTFQLLLLLCNTSICLLIDREWQKNTQRLVSRSSLPEVFFKKGVLRNFTKFTGKHLYQSLFFNKVAGLRSATLLKKRLLHRCVPVSFVRFLRTPFHTEQLRWLLLSQSLMKRFLTYSAILFQIKW